MSIWLPILVFSPTSAKRLQSCGAEFANLEGLVISGFLE